MDTSLEKTRRKVEAFWDDEPSLKHRFNYEIAKSFITKKKILDIGCWTGQFERFAVKEAKKIIGIDPGKEAISYAKKKVPEASFFTANAENLPFKDKSFDVVVFFDVLEHLPNNSEIQSLKEAYRVLDHDGYLILSTPNKNLFSILLDPAFFLLGHRHYSEKQLSSLLKKVDFQIIKFFRVGGFFHLTTHICDLILKHIFKKSFTYPRSLIRIINNEYRKGGFASLYVIAYKK